MGQKTKISIDYLICGDYGKVDPRNCGKCLRICDPAVFLLHETVGVKEENPFDPQIWRITPLWQSLCTHCMNCVNICPEKAIKISW